MSREQLIVWFLANKQFNVQYCLIENSAVGSKPFYRSKETQK